jgi:hypothetical protein
MRESAGEFLVEIHGVPRLLQFTIWHEAEADTLAAAAKDVSDGVKGRDLAHFVADPTLTRLAFFFGAKFAKRLTTMANFSLCFKPESVELTRDDLVKKDA